MHAVTCDHNLRSLATKNWNRLAWVGGVGWVGWDDHVPCTCTHPSRTHPLYSWVGEVGGVGWDDHVPCTCTHPSRTHPLYSWVGGGWGGMITYLALAHTLAEHIPCIHGWVWVGGVGWDDHVPCTCTHPSRTHPLYSWVGGVGGVG